MSESQQQRLERLQRLKLQAQQLIANQDPAQEPVPLSPEIARLLEDLRIYQVELELQNEELRRAQQEAETARARYQCLFEQMPLPALVLDAAGQVEHCNAGATDLLGPRAAYTHGDNRLSDRLARADRGRLHSALRNLTVEQPQVLERLQLADRQVESQARTMDGHLIQLDRDFHIDRKALLLLVDREAEIARERAQRFFSSILDGSDNPICATGTGGEFLVANRAMLRFLGRSTEEVLGQQRERFVPLRDAALHSEADLRVLETGEPVMLEERISGSPEGELELVTHKFPLRNAEGRIYGVGGISTDVTELKHQQGQARLSESVFLMASEAIIVTDPETRIVRVNPAFTAQSGFSEESVLGHLASFLKSGWQDEVAYQAMWEALERDGRWAGELRNRAADGRDYAVWSSISAIYDDRGRVARYMSIQTDLSALQAAQSQVQRLALFDSLTGLPNRALFEDRIRHLLAHAERHGEAFAVIFTDLDHFKEINDTLGHAVGDELLRQAAARLRSSVRGEDTVARMGGDEFVVLLPTADHAAALLVAEKMLQTLSQALVLDAVPEYLPTASAGIAVYPADGSDIEQLLRHADIAMYRAKQAGRNRVVVFDAQMAAENARIFAIQTDLASALLHGEFRVHFQPKFNLSTGRMVGAEALVRWQRPGLGLVSPADFIPVAEKSGLVVEIDRWVLNESLRQVGLWQRQGIWHAGWRVAVNQSARDLRDPSMLREVEAALQLNGVVAGALELEITESALLEHTDEVVRRLAELSALGVTLAIDDFGTNYSSLSYLSKLPVQVIKIDMSFVRNMLLNPSDRVLVETIITMAHNLGHQLVAEGVEDPAQRDQLLALGCEVGQGGLFGWAVNAEEFARQHFQQAAA
ncbi:putative Diguanylate cyclase [Rubrivivax sp. A210]|uniref:sensor domain-containing protein n=1 Tax=Rubrivivax sp. A210 TaxID=2772301 RepID=UPI001919134B|nr:bifunctional diguanylate cyclase/phosphodiesterase [Rubrivivax sp. A210]CAD5366442.1 putative Diguanylate cyclase [Rubrivivax sp. A210]